MNKATEAIREDGDVRRRLLEAATGLFVRKGYASTTVREVVAAAGVTPPVLYYYFGNKEGLYLEILSDAVSQFDAMVSSALALPGTAREKLTALTLACREVICTQLDVARLIYARDYGPSQGEPFFDTHALHERFRGVFRALVEEGVAAGEFTPGDVEGKLLALLSVVNIAIEIELCYAQGERPFDEAALGKALDVVFRGMSRT